jgi:hypothetical protein
MFMTPGALELILVFLGGASLRPWTAESTLERGSDMMAAGVECSAEAVGFLTKLLYL